jgi:hypothetical protein
MNRRIARTAVLVALTWLLAASNTEAFWRGGFYRGGYGGFARGYTYHNPYTGGFYHGGAAYNPYTGRYAAGRSFYNPYTNRYGHAAAVYNPYTGRYAYHYGVW